MRVGNLDRLFAAARDAVFGLFELELVDQRRKPLAVFGQIDRVGRGAEDRDARRLQRLRQIERRLPAELDDHALQRAVLLLDMQDFEHIFGGQRLEIQPVRRVIIGRHGLRVAVDHDRFITRIAPAQSRRGSSNNRTRSPARSGSARRPE